MGEQHPRLAGGTRVAIGGVRGNLFMPGRDEPDAALAEGIEQGDDRVAAQPEHDLDAQPLEVLGQQVGGDTGAGGRRGWGRNRG